MKQQTYEEKLEAALLAKKKRKAVKGGHIKPLNLLRNFLHQGYFYRDKTEKIMRAFDEIFDLSVIAFLSFVFFPSVLTNWIFWALSLFIVHLIHWIFNDNFRVCWIFTFPNAVNPSEKETVAYLNNMAKRLKSTNVITGVMLFGSISRHQWHSRSDIDARFLRAPGIWNGIKAYYLTCRERFIALMQSQPLDVYLVDDEKFIHKIRRDEPPLFLLKRDSRLDSFAGNSDEIVLTSLSDAK